MAAVYDGAAVGSGGVMSADKIGTIARKQSGHTMIREHALLPVAPALAAAFEDAFRTAYAHISASPGFRSLTLSRGIETPGTYLLLVEWDDVAAHEIGFRGSPAYAEWKRLLHGFYDPFPRVEHFAPVDVGAVPALS